MTELVDDRAQALRVGYHATDWNNRPSFDSYAAAMEDWDIKALVRNGVCIGAVYFNGDELHVSVLPAWRRRWATKGLLAKLFDRERVTTRVTDGHDHMHGILRRLGFENLDGLYVRGHANGH